eukprot:8328848-Prorocentrum_lima.AAC.1
MTSSLVGSEMCIRDSWRAVTALICAADGAYWTCGCISELFFESLKLFLSCLLYTSDAADDM